MKCDGKKLESSKIGEELKQISQTCLNNTGFINEMCGITTEYLMSPAEHG